MSTPFPPDNEGPERVRYSVRLEKDEGLELGLVATFWNDIDKVTGKKRRTKWKGASVVERFVKAQLDAFWDKVGAGGMSLAAKKEHLDKIVAQVKKDEAAKKPAKK